MKTKTRKIRYQSGLDAEDTLAKVRRLSETALFAPARRLHAVPLRPFCTPAAPPAWQYRRDWLLQSKAGPISQIPEPIS